MEYQRIKVYLIKIVKIGRLINSKEKKHWRNKMLAQIFKRGLYSFFLKSPLGNPNCRGEEKVELWVLKMI
ncbi:hypothetical protein DWB61_10910 [Ancylomarina euxinus]|uniref:Uncharacterized protein n=1 Tax=Ancylomarina euxinus TaxID=2283627 RepID=A0A425XZZ2_9BACT|nr:hypothetical protein DWB61_10910 [Ancylomarina euxinus]